ncbi:MAG: hypothetical protein AAGE52_30755 [Myxococcota bacterium]
MVGIDAEDSPFADGQRNVSVAVEEATNRVFVAYSDAASFNSTITTVAFEADGSEIWRREIGTYSRDTEPVAMDVAAGRVALAITDGVGVSWTVLVRAADGEVTNRLALGRATTDLAMDDEGGLIVVGEYRGGFSVGETTFPSVTWENIYVLRFDAAVEPVFGFSLGNPGVSDKEPAVGLAEDGSFYVAAATGGLPFTRDGQTFPGQGWLAAFDPEGTTRWVDGASLDGVQDIVVASTRVLLLAAADRGSVAGFDLSNETFVAGWTLSGDPSSMSTLNRFPVDEGGLAANGLRVYLSAPGRIGFTFGGLSIDGVASTDSMVASMLATGAPSWLMRLNASRDSEAHDVAASADFVVVAGRYTGRLDVPGISLPAGTAGSVFVARIDI